MLYRIKIAGMLDQSWTDWLGNVEITPEQQNDGSVVTILTVDLTDQSTLFGILDHIRDLNLSLLSVSNNED